MFWWGLLAIVLFVTVLSFEFIYWCSKDPAIDREIERKIGKELFQAEQDYRALRRSGKSD